MAETLISDLLLKSSVLYVSYSYTLTSETMTWNI